MSPPRIRHVCCLCFVFVFVFGVLSKCCAARAKARARACPSYKKTNKTTQVYLQPLFQLIETGVSHKTGRKLGPLVRVLARSLLVGLTLIVGLCVPFFGALMGIIGAAGITPTTFLLPPLLYIIYKQPARWSRDWIVNWSLVWITGAIGVLGVIGSFHGALCAVVCVCVCVCCCVCAMYAVRVYLCVWARTCACAHFCLRPPSPQNPPHTPSKIPPNHQTSTTEIIVGWQTYKLVF